MSMWVQHGYGKSDKIARLAERGLAQGVILSPADEERTNLAATAREATQAGLGVLLDPQLYVSTITGGTARCHEGHGLNVGRVHWGLNPQEIANHVSAVISANDALEILPIIAPTCIQRGFNDAWTTLAIQYARATIDSTDRDVFVSVAVEEAALSDWQRIEDWLDVVTTLDCRGFYLIVVRGPGDYPQPWNQTRLTNLLRLVYRLGSLNGYEVILGYSDTEGLLALAVGGHAFASGWYYTLRSFTETKWQPSSGGRAAKARITSPTLLTPFRAEDEANRLALSTYGQSIFSPPALVVRMATDPTSWSLPESWLQHLQVLGQAANAIAATSLTDRLTVIRLELQRAIRLYDQVVGEGVLLPPHYRGRLTTFLAALDEFDDRETVV